MSPSNISNQRLHHIDGLRSLAVFGVLLFHAFPDHFPNGFLGVDYFLVISGFVVSKRVLFDTSFAFIRFLTSRFRRLYPQLLICILLTTVLGYFLLQPDYYENLSQASIASLFGLNNILLFLTGGYWNLSNDFKPLYATWSLGLEQQFYLLFAVFLSSIPSKRYIYLFSSLFFLSFLLSFFTSQFLPEANYLLLPFRLWEFCLGILLVNFYQYITRIPRLIQCFCLFALLLFMFIPSPLFSASNLSLVIFPLLCCAVVLASPPLSPSSRLLCISPLPYIGLSSYAIYLYHQPILAFARSLSFSPLPINLYIILVLFSILVGVVMYELIEVRLPSFLISPSTLKYSSFTIFISSIFTLNFLAAFTVYVNQGLFALRFPSLLVNNLPPLGFLGGKGYTDIPLRYLENSFTSTANTRGTDINVLLIGNSNTRDLINTLQIVSFKYKSSNIQFSYFRDILSFSKSSSFDSILSNTQVVVLQRDRLSSNSLPDFLNLPSLKVIVYSSPGRYIYNVNPFFLLSPTRRSSLQLSTNLSCDNSSLFTVVSSNLAVLDPQCAFLYKQSVVLSDDKNQLFTFDGIHLSEAGAEFLADKLLNHKHFMKYLTGRTR